MIGKPVSSHKTQSSGFPLEYQEPNLRYHIFSYHSGFYKYREIILSHYKEKLRYVADALLHWQATPRKHI